MSRREEDKTTTENLKAIIRSEEERYKTLEKKYREVLFSNRLLREKLATPVIESLHHAYAWEMMRPERLIRHDVTFHNQEEIVERHRIVIYYLSGVGIIAIFHPDVTIPQVVDSYELQELIKKEGPSKERYQIYLKTYEHLRLKN